MKDHGWFARFLRPVAPYLMALGAPLLASCESTGVMQVDSGVEPGMDGGQRVRQIRYTPEGCGYEVATPDLEAAGMSQDVFASEDFVRHIHVSWAGPSHTSFAVNWNGALDTLASRVLYGTDRDAVSAADADGAGVLGQVGHFMMYGRGPYRTRVHEAHVCGLMPSTTYYYKVGGPGHWSEVLEVTTAPEPGSTEPFAFGVTGDSRNNNENSWPLSQRRLLEAGIDFQVFSGDAVFLGANQADWELFFNATDGDFHIQDMLSRVPFMMANGNHDGLAVNYLAQFAYPQERSPSEQAEGEEWYSFDYGNAHFVVLNDSVGDTAVISGSQAQWLRQDLARVDRTRTPWLFAVHHRPFYTCRSNHAPYLEARAGWQPIFDEYAVDVVFTGHNHVYERSRPIRGLEGGEGVVAQTTPDGRPVYDGAGRPSGTVYVVAAGVGAELYDVSTDCPTTLTALRQRPYVVVEIDHRTLRYTAYDAMDGSVIDSFTVTK